MIRYEIIIAAKQGDSEAIAMVVKHYASYIRTRSKRNYYDHFGNRREYVDEYVEDEIEAALVQQIVFKFDPTRKP